MKSVEELREHIKKVAWSCRHISTAGVVPVSLAWELIEEIEERDSQKGEHIMAIGINTATPTRPIDILIGVDHFTDENIRKWATGDLRDIDFAVGEESLIIEYLSQIIVEKILRD